MGYIKNDKYFRGEPEVIKPNDQYKAYRHETQRQDHKVDIIQPRIAGKPNPEFIRNYPERAKDYFSKEDYERGMNG